MHIEETIQAIARLHAEHRARATRHHRVFERVTSVLGRPGFIIALTLLVAGWIAVNAFAPAFGYRPLDPPPFPLLTGFASLTSLYLAVVIVTTQRRNDRLGRDRELLTIELAILAEQKTAKAIALLEELRRDSPQVRDRVDRQAEAMSQPTHPQTVMDAIMETRTEGAHLSRETNGARGTP